MELLDRIRGCLLGGAAGDALGGTVEFLSYEKIQALYGPEGIRAYDLHEGKALITDDTQMTLFTCEGIIMGWDRAVAGGMAAEMEVYVHDAYLNWLRTQGYPAAGMWLEHSRLMACPELFAQRAPGNTCLAALASGRMGSLQEPINNSKGCGGVMRVAPVGFVGAFGRRYDDAPEDAPLWQAAKIAAITHGHPLGYIPAAMLAELIRLIAMGSDDLEKAALLALEKTERLLVTDESIRGLGFAELMREAIALSRKNMNDVCAIKSLGAGWVAEEAMAIALYCALKYRHDFSACICAAVNHDGDSDSTGAVAGNILGAWLGAEGIPQMWIEPLEAREAMEDEARRLREVAREQGLQ